MKHKQNSWMQLRVSLLLLLACTLLSCTDSHDSEESTNSSSLNPDSSLSNDADVTASENNTQANNVNKTQQPLSLHQAAESGNLAAMVRFIESGEEINAKDSEGNTPLHLASLHGHDQAIELLIENNAQNYIKNNAGLFPIHLAAVSGSSKAVTVLLDADSPAYALDSSGRMPLSFAGSTDVVRVLLQAGANVDAQSEDGLTALIAAANSGKNEVLDALLAAGANPNLTTGKGWTALMSASTDQGGPGIVKALIDAGAEIDARYSYEFDRFVPEGTTALMIASGNRYSDDPDGSKAARSTKALLAAGANFSLKDKNGETALIQAAKNPQGGPCTQALLAAGANGNALDRYGRSAYIVAIVSGSSSADILRVAGADTTIDLRNKDGETELTRVFSYSLNEYVDFYHSEPEVIVKRLLDANANPRVRTKNNLPLLIVASGSYTSPQAIQLLLDAGAAADINTQDDAKRSPLMHAAGNIDVNLLPTLLKAGANVNATDEYEFTPLMLVRGYYDVKSADKIKLLLESGADAKARNKSGETALHAAVGNMDAESVSLLIGDGADVNATTVEGETVLMRAVSSSSREAPQVVTQLLEAGASINTSTSYRDGNTALMIASKYGQLDLVKVILNRGADVNLEAKNKFGMTALFFACVASRDAKGKMLALLEAGADIEATTHVGGTPLMSAVFANKPESIDFLLERGADISSRISDGTLSFQAPSVAENGATALMLAAQVNSGDAFNTLIARGADPTKTDYFRVQDTDIRGKQFYRRQDRTLLYYAAQSDSIEMVKAVLELGIVDPTKHWRNDGWDQLVQVFSSGRSLPVLLEAESKEGVPLVMLAARDGAADAVETLLEAGFDPNTKTQSGKTLLMYASQGNVAGTPKLIKMLIQEGADIEASDEQGWTPLIWASRYNSERGTEALIESGANIEAKDKKGRTPLMHSVLAEKQEGAWDRGSLNAQDAFGFVSVFRLLDAGADKSVKDSEGKRASDHVLRFTISTNILETILQPE